MEYQNNQSSFEKVIKSIGPFFLFTTLWLFAIGLLENSKFTGLLLIIILLSHKGIKYLFTNKKLSQYQKHLEEKIETLQAKYANDEFEFEKNLKEKMQSLEERYINKEYELEQIHLNKINELSNSYETLLSEITFKKQCIEEEFPKINKRYNEINSFNKLKDAINKMEMELNRTR